MASGVTDHVRDITDIKGPIIGWILLDISWTLIVVPQSHSFRHAEWETCRDNYETLNILER